MIMCYVTSHVMFDVMLSVITVITNLASVYHVYSCMSSPAYKSIPYK